MPPRPTTSTYALLGLLAICPWSAYELAQQATRSLRYAHPRTESHLYEEAKRLEALGWATSRTEHQGRRQRTVYEITDDGRSALHAWFATPPRDPQLGFEALLRLMFADQTDKATLDRCLEETAESARRLFDDAVERLLRPYVTEDGGPFPERRHIAALVAAFVADYLHLIERWSEFARDEIRSWPRTDGLGMTERTRHILDAVLNGRSVLEPDR
ncbi:MAG TPA: PadR family transcriptional regulator [Acidimicrobiales bacterium]|nr:PadR family transcriptional regulator [Acidimicrobiales bacterium]